VALHVVGQAEPLDGHREHPVHGPLQLLPRLAARRRQPLHPDLAVAQVERLLQVHLHERALQRAVAGVAVHVAEQRDAGAVEEAVRRDELRPALERLVEAVRVLELVGLAAVDELLLVEAHVLQDAVRDVRVRELVLDDGHGGDHGVGRRRVLRRHPVGRRAHQLGVRLDEELHDERLAVALRHLVRRLEDVALVDLLLDLVFGEAAHVGSPAFRTVDFATRAELKCGRGPPCQSRPGGRSDLPSVWYRPCPFQGPEGGRRWLGLRTISRGHR
jgi:hypothetical protein